MISAAAFGEVVLENGRQHRGLFAQVDGVGGEDTCRVHQPGVAADARQRFLDAFEGGERHVELLADLRIATAHVAADLGGAGAGRRQEIERPTDRQFISIIQPLPIMSRPPMMASSGTKTSLPQFGPFMKAAPSGRWRRPISTPGVSVGISAG